MKTGVIIGIIIIVILLAGGFWFLSISKDIENAEDSIGSGDTGISNNLETEASLSDEVVDTSQEQSSPNSYSVDIEDFAFASETLTIKVGDTVTWTNRDSAGHTVTSDSGSKLDSILLKKGQSYSHTFNEVGTFDYHCTPHPYMKGIIIVE